MTLSHEVQRLGEIVGESLTEDEFNTNDLISVILRFCIDSIFFMKYSFDHSVVLKVEILFRCGEIDISKSKAILKTPKFIIFRLGPISMPAYAFTRASLETARASALGFADVPYSRQFNRGAIPLVHFCCVQANSFTMALVNKWYLRRVAEASAKPCDICYKPTTSVLITPDNKV